MRLRKQIHHRKQGYEDYEKRGESAKWGYIALSFIAIRTVSSRTNQVVVTSANKTWVAETLQDYCRLELITGKLVIVLSRLCGTDASVWGVEMQGGSLA